MSSNGAFENAGSWKSKPVLKSIERTSTHAYCQIHKTNAIRVQAVEGSSTVYLNVLKIRQFAHSHSGFVKVMKVQWLFYSRTIRFIFDYDVLISDLE